MKEILAVLLAAITTGCSTVYSTAEGLIAHSYYPMMSDVAVIQKSQDGQSYSFTVLEIIGFQGEPDTCQTYQWVFACSKEDYEGVEVGDVINCSRLQSALTYRGKDLEIRKNLGHMDHLPNGYLYHIAPSNKS